MSDGRAGIYAGVVAIVVTVALGGVGAAGADERDDALVHARENAAGNVFCFTTDATSTCAAGNEADVRIQPGEKVTWTWTNSSQPHNVASNPPAWKYPENGDFVTSGTFERTFDEAGTYAFLCQVHPAMQGTITVGDGGTPTPSPSPSPTPTPTASPPASPPPVDITPPPVGGDDNVRPAVSRVRAKALRRAVRVRFRLSEAATVTIRVMRRGRTVKAARVHAAAGTHSVTLRSRRLRPGRYTIRIQARDAFGNRSRLATDRLRLRRR
jgi:plastocyanin